MNLGVMLIWPMVAVLGFLALIGLVVALGASSTARYEFERNRVGQQAGAARGARMHPAGRRAASPRAEAPPAATGPRPEAVGVAVRPAASPAVDGASGTGWWLVQESEDGSGAQAVAGPFPGRMDADWAALASGLPAHAVHGALRPDGALVLRPSPAERAWLAELGQQLDRLPEDWAPLQSDTHPLTTLVVEVAAAIVESGLPLHDCALRTPGEGGAVGGVCLIPSLDHRGVLVTWHPHDRMTLQQVRGTAADAAVQHLMNAAVTDVLAQLGFAIEPFGSTGGCLVTALRS